MKTTLGSWRYLPEFDAVVVVQGNEVKAVADFGKTDLTEKEANAKLMGAAKELLEGVKEAKGIIMELCQSFGVPLPQATLDRIDAAVKKATGGQL